MGKVAIILAILLIVIVLAAAIFFAYPLLFPKPSQNPNPPIVPPSNPPVVPSQNNTTSPPTPDSDPQWEFITLPNVESACLKVSRQEAESMGYPPGVVQDCACIAQESEERKSYDCKISALDGTHPGEVSCFRTSRTCTITSERGTYSYTFEQLAQMSS